MKSILEILFLYLITEFLCCKLAEAVPACSFLTPPIEIVGNKFFVSDSDKQFFMKGIAYQPSRKAGSFDSDLRGFHDTKYIDPLSDPKMCLRDIPHLKKLNINTIRVYSIDPTASHDICMQALADAGIYVLLDLAEPDTSIARDRPSWDVIIWKRYKDVVDSMQKYPNLLGFFSGNEVTNDITNTDASPFVKAAIRDVKHYIAAKAYRKIPVGYSTNDDADTRDQLAQYFSCGGDLAADFYGINMYEWCGYSSYGTSGYKERTEEFKDFPIPVFFSEFGCNLVRPRPFTEVGALYGPKMSKVWSGGLAYMYFEEENEYGVVKIGGNGEVVELADFENLRNEFSKVSDQGISKKEYLKTVILPQETLCPKSKIDSKWKASENIPHTPDDFKCQCLQKSLPYLVKPFKNPVDYQKHFDRVCCQVNCSDTIANGELGIYGEYSDCTPEQKLSLQISKLHSKKVAVSPPLPIEGGNIYYNPDYQDITSGNDECSKMIGQLLGTETKFSKPSQSGDKLVGGNLGSKFLESNSGLPAHHVNSGCAILFFSIFIASFLL